MTHPVYNGYPALKCHFENCQNEGNSICKWKFSVFSKSLGCKRRYCKDHRHKRIEDFNDNKHRYSHVYVSECCVACMDTMNEDWKQEEECSMMVCGILCSVVLIIILIA